MKRFLDTGHMFSKHIHRTNKNKYNLILDSKKKDPHPIHRIIYGATAGAVAQTVSYPFDVVRRRLQTATILKPNESNISIIRLFVLIWQREGVVHGFYKGLSLNWIKGPVAAGVGFMVFDMSQMFIRRFYIYVYEND